MVQFSSQTLQKLGFACRLAFKLRQAVADLRWLKSQEPKPYNQECMTSSQKVTGSQALSEVDRPVGVNNSAVQASACSRVRSRSVPPLLDAPGTPSVGGAN